MFLKIHKIHRKACKTLAQVFSSEFCELSKNAIFTEHLDCSKTTASERRYCTAKLNICHPFAVALVLIRSSRRKRKKKKVADGVSGFHLYLLLEQLAVLPQMKVICLCSFIHHLLQNNCLYTCSIHAKC